MKKIKIYKNIQKIEQNKYISLIRFFTIDLGKFYKD
jgi:hypothetical protein